MAARKKKLPRLVPGGATKPRPTREIDLPGIGASVVIQVPTVGAWYTIERIEDRKTRDIAVAALALIEPEMTAEQLEEAVKEWPISDWLILDEALTDLMDGSEEALRAAQREFRGADN